MSRGDFVPFSFLLKGQPHYIIRQSPSSTKVQQKHTEEHKKTRRFSEPTGYAEKLLRFGCWFVGRLIEPG